MAKSNAVGVGVLAAGMTDNLTTYGLLVPGAGSQTADRMTNCEKEFLKAVNAQPELQRKHDSITVWREDVVLFVHCGHCLKFVMAKMRDDDCPPIDSGHFCCHWAAAMYQRYFEHNLVWRVYR